MAESSNEVTKQKDKRLCLAYPIQRIVLIGAPGSGKGTHSAWLKHDKKLVQLSTGDMLRDAVAKKTELGMQVEQIMARGELVSDDIVCAIVESELQAMVSGNTMLGGFLLDGFPRTLHQAENLEAILDRLKLPLTGVFYLNCADSVLKERVCGRLIHPGSGRVYHSKLNPPRTMFKDDVTGEDLIQREDDCEDVFNKRIQNYLDATTKVVSFYKDKKILYEIDAAEQIPAVRAEFERIFNEATARARKYYKL